MFFFLSLDFFHVWKKQIYTHAASTPYLKFNSNKETNESHLMREMWISTETSSSSVGKITKIAIIPSKQLKKYANLLKSIATVSVRR